MISKEELHEWRSQTAEKPLSEALRRVSNELLEVIRQIEPVLDWYQPDDQMPRPLGQIIRDMVADLQSDRKQSTRPETPGMVPARRSAMPRSISCPRCGAIVHMTDGGNIGVHPASGRYSRLVTCPASGKPAPPEVKDCYRRNVLVEWTGGSYRIKNKKLGEDIMPGDTLWIEEPGVMCIRVGVVEKTAGFRQRYAWTMIPIEHY